MEEHVFRMELFKSSIFYCRNGAITRNYTLLAMGGVLLIVKLFLTILINLTAYFSHFENQGILLTKKQGLPLDSYIYFGKNHIL